MRLEGEPRPKGGVLSKSAFLPRLFGGLLCLLPRILAGLLARLVVLTALLRLALVVLIHVNLLKITEV
jgi:hypothetical protein